MEIRLRIIIVVTTLSILAGLINMVRKEKLDLKYALSWIVIDLSVMVLGFFPEIIDVIARMMGVGIPINAIFFIAIVFLLIIIYSLTVAQSRNSKKLRSLIQQFALSEYEKQENDHTL